MFAKLYGGLKVGYLKRIDVFYSLTLATILYQCCDVFSDHTDQQMVYVGQTGDRNDRSPAYCDGTVIWGSQVYLLQTVRARRLLVIWETVISDVIHKMNTRRINTISAVRFISVRGEEKIHAMMEGL